MCFIPYQALGPSISWFGHMVIIDFFFLLFFDATGYRASPGNKELCV